MLFLISDRGFYAGWNVDRPRWQHSFKLAEGFQTIGEAKNVGMLDKMKGRIKYFEILQVAGKGETIQEQGKETSNRQEVENLRGDESL